MRAFLLTKWLILATTCYTEHIHQHTMRGKQMKKHYILYLLVISSLISARPGMKTAAALLPKSSWYKRDPNPPLITAIMEGNIPEVTRLLEEGADPNERNSTTGSPLFFATNKKDPIITQLLLKHGANPNAISMTKNLSPWRELDNAIAFGTEEHIKLLLKYDTDPFQLRDSHVGINRAERIVLCRDWWFGECVK